MDDLSKSMLFAAGSGLFLGSGILSHVVGFRLGRRVPIRLLRTFYSCSVVCAAVGMLAFGDYLFA
jgi:hypothetical protein